MGLWRWFTTGEWQEPERGSVFDEIEERMRQQNPDYDDEKRVRAENYLLEQRRDYLAQIERGKRLRAEIAELEKNAATRKWAEETH